MPNAALDKIQDRIRKLLALGESANEHEAKLAMKNAQKLMNKYNIDQADVLINISSSDITHEDFLETAAPHSSVASLGGHVCRLFDCQVIIMKKVASRRHTMFRFVGTTENIASARYMLTHLMTCWKSMHIADFKAHQADTHPALQAKKVSFRNAHRAGFSESIGKRVDSLLKARTTELNKASGNAALVPVKMSEAVKAYSDEKFDLKKGRAGRTSSNAGRSAGRAAGNSVPMGGAIAGKGAAGALN